MKLNLYFPFFSGRNKDYLQSLKNRLLQENSFDSYILNPADHEQPGISRKSLWTLGRELGFKMIDPYFNRIQTNNQPAVKEKKGLAIKKSWEKVTVRSQRITQRKNTLKNKELREKIGTNTKKGMKQSDAAQKNPVR